MQYWQINQIRLNSLHALYFFDLESFSLIFPLYQDTHSDAIRLRRVYTKWLGKNKGKGKNKTKHILNHEQFSVCAFHLHRHVHITVTRYTDISYRHVHPV